MSNPYLPSRRCKHAFRFTPEQRERLRGLRDEARGKTTLRAANRLRLSPGALHAEVMWCVRNAIARRQYATARGILKIAQQVRAKAEARA